jgi:hypothetical protein
VAHYSPLTDTDPSGHRPCSDDPNFSECEKGLPHAPKNNQDDPVKLDTYYSAADIRSFYIKYKYTKGWWNDDGYGSAYFTELDFLELMLSYEFSPLPTTATFAEEYPGVLEDLSHGTSHWYNSRCELLSGGACSGVSPNGIFNFLAASQSMRGRMDAVFSGMASLGAVTQYGASNMTVAHAVVANLVNPPNPEWRRGGASIQTAIDKTHPYTWGNRSMLPGDPLNPIWQYGLPGQDTFYILPVEVQY